MGLAIPGKLRELLADSSLEPDVLGFVRAADPILLDNKTPFFPAYTDHGSEHVQQVLDAVVRLIPDEVFDRGLLGSSDAAVLVAATVLHDLGLHVREEGLLELVTEGTRFKPLPWFDSPQATRSSDASWPVLWERFRQEARRFTTTQVDRLLGPGNAGIPAVAYGDADRHPDRWTTPDRLLVGEFMRRHHGRLSHEIAIHGFPGAGEDYLALGRPAPLFAEAAGAVARSHAEDLRVMLAYLDYKYGGNQRPADALLPYLMGLLRAADYLQVDAARAPTVLLRMKSPQSPQSIDEWSKHGAVASVSWDHRDPLAVFVHVSPSHELRTHLQLAELFTDLQREFDTTVAVLAEVYATEDFAPVRLARQRLRTNLHDQSLHDQLPYVPRRGALRSADDLFRLVIKDLYGDVPAVAGRELLQNAVDAVRERRRWEEKSGRAVPAAEFRDLPADVLVEIELRDEDHAVFRVADRGIGMTPETVVDHFLCAGSSLRPTSAEYDEVDAETAVRWMRAGRFGVGALAAFLLGSELHVRTRHVEADRGVEFVARLDDDLVQLDWANVPVGTEVCIPFAFSPETGSGKSDLLRDVGRLYQLAEPTAALRLVDPEGIVVTVGRDGDIPSPGEEGSTAWRGIRPAGLDAVLWRVPNEFLIPTSESSVWPNTAEGAVVHNGMSIKDLRDPGGDDIYEWSDRELTKNLAAPQLAVFDSRHRLGVSLTRYGLTHPVLPFESELLASIGLDLVARALVGGVAPHPLGRRFGLQPVVRGNEWAPLFPGLVTGHATELVCTAWDVRFPGDHLAALEQAVSQRFGVPWHATLPISPSAQAARGRPGFLPAIERLSRVVGTTVGWAPIASAVVSPDRLAVDAESGWKSLDAVAGAPFNEYVNALTSDEAARATQPLLSTAMDLVVNHGWRDAKLTVFRAEAGGVLSNEVAETWSRLLGGPAPRDEQARHEKLAELVARHEELRQHVDAWWRELNGEPLPF